MTGLEAANARRWLARSMTFVIAMLAMTFCFAITARAENAASAGVMPAPLSSELAALRAKPAQPALTSAVLSAYVERRKALESFNAFDVPGPPQPLTGDVLSSYIERRSNPALDAIAAVDFGSSTVSTDALAAYVQGGYVPTGKRVKLATEERDCLAKAIYHEARGESEDGQWAVANVIINRAFSKKYPSTLCGVIYQNADKGRYRCQFTFACDGRSDVATEPRAWRRAQQMAEDAYADYVKGDTPDMLPRSVLYYHTTAVAPHWSKSFRRVAAIGSHIFYSPN
ncbi:cell wall hydrolase [Devosia enhydra]|uniref:cell wall hydrolase n=1 Tax=Devosia enhydra TaxID=665118 RepID=UPI001160C039|nr:cell wall hydrolase [Devosia enhydra]